MQEEKISILITGASGFIGKNLTEYLLNKYIILTPSHAELDLLDKTKVNEYFEKNEIDILIHAASLGVKRNASPRADLLKNNLTMFFNLLENKHKVKKMIFLGSGAEYDKTRDLINVKEEEFGKFIPSDDYGFYKYICSKIIENSENIIGLKIFGIFGKYEDYSTRFISNIICRNLYSLPIEINQNRKMSYIYIDDFCKIIEYFINNKSKEKLYNVGGGRYELLYLAEKIKDFSNDNFDILMKKEGLDKEYTCDDSLLKGELNGKINFTKIENSLKEVYDWYKLNREQINKEALLNP